MGRCVEVARCVAAAAPAMWRAGRYTHSRHSGAAAGGTRNDALLADHIQLAATHVTTEVGRLIAKGLLIKAVNRRDRRGVLIRLSPRGESAVREVAPFVRRVNDLLFAGVSRDEFAAVSEFLTRFAANTEDALDELRRTVRRSTDGGAFERAATRER
jgi:DNA-binding MarR family transcriptional regulator